ncbi:FAD-dependent oxidoreductase [Paraburkholderia sp. BCC1885]|uniref:FAD-dependent oxidoreductase n=1 Tax=Paraburkholderia sp. BCC1885 TaxID=2562669 RepID=UPI001182C77C|nr:FAD-dependent oxidoreductase [Paraburkholderia sp. BCC1885]
MSAVARRVIPLTQLPEDHATRVEVDGEKILLIRNGETVHAYSADCPHAGGPLEEGALCNGHIICPWHKGTFDVATGDVLEPPALISLDRYPVSVQDGEVMVTPQKIDRPGTAAATDAANFVVIGAGAAGAAACAALRANGFTGHLTLIGEESQAPYDRTALSKFVPSGAMKTADVPPLLPEGWLEEQHVERVTGTIVKLDVPQRQIYFDDGRTLTYDTALLAPGSKPHFPPVQGRDLEGVYALRTLHDATDLCDGLEAAKRVVIVGSSFIGLEAASALRERGVAVTVVAPAHVPFEHQFGARMGALFQQLHESHGVTFRLGEQLAELAGFTHVREAVLKSGTRIAADVVLLATGVSPVTGFIDGLPLQKDGGVLVNAGMQAAPGLYAAGDIAAFPLYEDQEPVRIEHWRLAQQHAFIAAQNMCGARNRYAGVPYFWTYHYGKTFEYLGYASGWDEVVIDGDLEQHRFLALYVKANVVVAALACERAAATARLIESMQTGLSAAEALRLVKDQEAATAK